MVKFYTIYIHTIYIIYIYIIFIYMGTLKRPHCDLTGMMVHPQKAGPLGFPLAQLVYN